MVVWSGAAVFAGAIAYSIYMYVVGFDHLTAGWPIWMAAASNVTLFALFALHHSFFARPTVKDTLERALPARLPRALYVWVASVLLIGQCAAWQRVDVVLYWQHGAWEIAHYILQTVGLIISGLGLLGVDLLELSGLRAARPRLAGISRTGLHSFVRHPTYTGWVLFVVATPHMDGARLLFAGLTLVYVLVAIPWEERDLVSRQDHFYREYMGRVRWRLVPGIY